MSTQIPPELAERIFAYLPPNDIACTARLVNKAAAAHFSGPQYTVVRLSLPVPEHAFKHHWGRPDATRGLIWDQRVTLVRLTARSGCIANLELALDSTELPISSSPSCQHARRLFEVAAAAGQLEVCQWLQQRGCDSSLALSAAAEAGQRAVCEWGLAAGWPLTDLAVYAAARGGQVGLLEWLLQLWPQDRPPVNAGTLLESAAQGCELGVLKDLWEQHGERLQGWETLDIMEGAACSLTPDWQAKVEWLEEHGAIKTHYICDRATICPDAGERLRWLHARGYPITAHQTYLAMKHNNLEALRYLLQQGIRPSGRGAANGAAYSGNVAALELLCYPADEVQLRVAAQGGHMPAVISLMRRMGRNAPVELWGDEEVQRLLSVELFDAAAKSGNMELMRWLRQRGCPWGPGAVHGAAAAGWVEGLEWLVEQGCPMPESGSPYKEAAADSDMATLRCLRRLGCPWGPHGKVFMNCIGQCEPSVLQFLLDEGCPVDWVAAVQTLAKWLAGSARGAQERWEWLRASSGEVWWRQEGYTSVDAALQAALEKARGEEE
ncbi:hypothetical protein Agub_g6843 [Astrephomene gubernaculifera]|uniref:Ankyrin repeat domain-containing protein n=1 Tax=Astrephomene gubernaculifera TaxID=47775 RepID=A0AAD3DRU1_9CHLO|nr:hypothetical protein Agub_g6843 [Astrephomene gubernaculifera]